ncbi:MAG TPA: ribonuclease P protein component [Chitinophagaceae bacterium]|nr:ribonuclease P protein component [Chitinophagaceae bacterium]
MTIEQQFTFKKEEKLKSRKLIEILFKQGTSFSNFPFRILYIFSEKGISPLQCGFAVSGKHFKKAVDRNRIKRLMREAYRLQKSRLTETVQQQEKCMAVFFIYTGNEIPGYNDVFEKMESALKRLNKIANEVGASNT